MQKPTPCPACGHIKAEPWFWIDDGAHELHVDGEIFKLRPMDGQIVAVLMDVWPRVARREFIMDCLYGADPNGGPCDRSIDVRMVTLRKLLANTRLGIETIRNVGFRFVEKEGNEHG